MAEDWAIDVRKYAPDAEDAVIKGIVRHCGIALRSRDASLVSFTDKAETDRVRESFCKKKLGLTLDDSELDAAIARVGERMKADRTKNRVTVYYLLAEEFGKLALFGATAAAAAKPAAMAAVAQPPEPAEPAVPVAPVAPAAPLAAAAPETPVVPAATVAAAAAIPAAAGKPAPAQQAKPDDGGIVSTGLIALGAMGLIVLGTATAGSLVGDLFPKAPTAPVTATPVATRVPAVPQGSGVVAQLVAGKPQLSVYFDTASADVSPDFEAAAAPIKAWIEANPAARLAVSGYNDPRGDAAMNAELSKTRAQNVAAALAATGVPADAIDLEKPAETSDTGTSLENARRVDIIIKDG